MYSVHDELLLTFALDENDTFWLTGVWDFYLCVQGGDLVHPGGGTIVRPLS